MSTQSKVKTNLKTNAKGKKPDFVRIVIDEKLALIIEEIQEEYPLLSRAEAVKVILSRGVNKSKSR